MSFIGRGSADDEERDDIFSSTVQVPAFPFDKDAADELDRLRLVSSKPFFRALQNGGGEDSELEGLRRAHASGLLRGGGIVLFSDISEKINRRGKVQRRLLVVTPYCIYSLKQLPRQPFSSQAQLVVKRKISITQVPSSTLSTSAAEVAVHVTGERDYLFRLYDVLSFASVLKHVGVSLHFVKVDGGGSARGGSMKEASGELSDEDGYSSASMSRSSSAKSLPAKGIGMLLLPRYRPPFRRTTAPSCLSRSPNSSAHQAPN
mmetsp:Transcript_8938/g.24363  ORF Transcript_8938/g.24363 Transcript_8938/m.24363 type:complete len:261 (-) Transcript_8938:790-1572(-)